MFNSLTPDFYLKLKFVVFGPSYLRNSKRCNTNVKILQSNIFRRIYMEKNADKSDF
jgi:hypothetical protein